MKMNIVLFPYVLVLSNWQLHDDGSVKSGWVVNGAWWYASSNGFVYSCRTECSDTYVTKWDKADNEYYVAADARLDYNAAIALAELSPATPPEQLLTLQKLQQNMKSLRKTFSSKRKSFWQDSHGDYFDDDIPF